MFRAALILALPILACGEASTIELDPTLPMQKTTTPPETDAGFPASDASVRPIADVVPGVVDFGRVGVGRSTEHLLMLINRNREPLRVQVRSEHEAFSVVGPTGYELNPETRRDMWLRFAPNRPGVHEEQLEIDACGEGCILRVRMVGLAL